MDWKIKYKDIYLSVVFPIYVIATLLSSTNLAFAPEGEVNQFQMILKLIRYVIYVISIIYALTNQIKQKAVFYALLVAGIVLISLAFNHNVQIICSLFVFCALLNYPWERILKRHVLCLVIVLAVIIIASQLGIIEDAIRIEANRPPRHFLGFNWVTYSPIMWFFVSLGFCCIKKGKIKLVHAAILAGVSAFLYLLTDTRMAFLMNILVIIFFLFYHWYCKYSKSLKRFTRVTIGAPVVCAIISIIIAAVYDPKISFLEKLNKALSQRLYFGHKGIVDFGVKIIGGQPIEWRGFDMTVTSFRQNDYNYVDCTYLHVLLEYGLVFLLMFICLLVYGIYKAYKNGKYYLCWTFCFLCIFGMIEPWLLSFTFNPFLWCGVALFSGKRRKQAAEPLKVT